MAMRLDNAGLLSRDKPTSCIQFLRQGDLVEFADPCPQDKHTDLFSQVTMINEAAFPSVSGVIRYMKLYIDKCIS